MKKRRRKGKGYSAGCARGYPAGYNEGFGQGREVGRSSYPGLFDGTSIIIPTYNKCDYLQECIASVQRYTPPPYEIIVIDNGSTDGTAAYLRSMAGRVRYRIHASNLGFAGAVNQGLMMAKGTTILILNNDSVVTANWLNNLLHCLHSHPEYGIVGPVTNYISGEQLIQTKYGDIEEMQQFAALYNRPDPGRWTVTGRLTGFCMLMRREDFERIGYFDEGFEIGNCEDDDYGLRARLLGLQLVIAKDTFIHHYGSVSMRSLNDQFDAVYEHNLAYYSRKWTDPSGLLSMEWQHHAEPGRRSSADSYPTGVLVQGTHSLYWIENGRRYPVAADCGLPAVRLSQVDLRHWQAGETIAPDEVRHRIHMMYGGGSTEFAAEGRLFRLENGQLAQLKGGRLHPFLSQQAAEDWKLAAYVPAAAERAQIAAVDGAPIIPPLILKSEHL